MKTGKIVVLCIVLLFISFNFWQYRQLDSFQGWGQATYSEEFKVMGEDMYQWQVKVSTPFTILNLSQLLKYPDNLLLDEGMLIFEIPFRVTPRKLFKISDEDVIDFPHELIGGNWIDRFFANRHFKATSLLTSDGKSPRPEDYAKEFFDRRGFLTKIIWWGKTSLLFLIDISILLFCGIIWMFNRMIEMEESKREMVLQDVQTLLSSFAVVNLEEQFKNRSKSCTNRQLELLQRITAIRQALLKFEKFGLVDSFQKKLEELKFDELIIDIQREFNKIAQSELMQQESSQKQQQHQQAIEKGKEELDSLFARHMALWAFKDNVEHAKVYRAVGSALDGIRDELDKQKVSLRGFNFVREKIILLENVKKGVKK